MTPPNARSAELLRRWLKHGDCAIPASLYADTRAFLAAEPQQDWASHRANMSEGEWAALQQDSNEHGPVDLTNVEPDRLRAPPIQTGEVAALIERLRAWHLNEPPQFRHWASIWNDMRQAADLLARLAAERDAAYERCAKLCDAAVQARPYSIMDASANLTHSICAAELAAACRALAAPANEGEG
jgi:hypothetical protein